jgi:hypothetical protein
MILKSGAVWRFRKCFARKVREGQANLRVIGSEKEGFNLAAQRGEMLVPLFAVNRFGKQKDAVAYGEAHYNAKAVKYIAPKVPAVA